MVFGPLDDLSRPRHDRPLHNLHTRVCYPDTLAQADRTGSSSSHRGSGFYLDTGHTNNSTLQNTIVNSIKMFYVIHSGAQTV